MTNLIERHRFAVIALIAGVAVLALLVPRSGNAAGTGATASAAKTVAIKGFAFKPATLKVSRGTRVTFANSSDVPHTATGGGFDTKRIAPGASATVKFGKRGSFAYHCKIHPFMKGKVVVE
ncbi:MAG TPA: cupredoxin domain-containing protein [Solirubrobacterales bacterium]|nr:cupredoxin domain-containing protein [Solirubrobacterales bacterium]